MWFGLSRFVWLVGNPDSVAGEFGVHSLYKMLGYFSLVGLLRLHSLLGDYYQALKVLDNIDFNKKVSCNCYYYYCFTDYLASYVCLLLALNTYTYGPVTE